MTARERMLTWSTLLTLTCLVLLTLLRPQGNMALAEDEAKAEALGPAKPVR